MWNQPPFFEQRGGEVVGRQTVHDDDHPAAGDETLLDDTGIPVAKALLLQFGSDLIGLHRIVDDRKLGPKARYGSTDRRRQALPALRGGQEVFGQLGEHRPGRFGGRAAKSSRAGSDATTGRQVVTIADAKNALRGFDTEQPGREEHRDD